MNISHINPQIGDVVEVWKPVGKHHVMWKHTGQITQVIRRVVPARGRRLAYVKEITLTIRNMNSGPHPQMFEVKSSNRGLKIRKLPEAEAAVILVHES